MIHQWKKALLERAAGIFERGGKETFTCAVVAYNLIRIPKLLARPAI